MLAKGRLGCSSLRGAFRTSSQLRAGVPLPAPPFPQPGFQGFSPLAAY